MNFIINDFNIYYEKYGNKGKNIVIIPGWGNNRETFKYIIDFLKRFFVIYIIDLPGFGKSKIPSRDLTIYDYADMVKEFININNIDDPILIGHSFGGRIIITLCGYYQILYNKIILIDSAGIKPKKKLGQLLKQGIYKLLKLIKWLLPKKYKEKYINGLINIFASYDYKSLDKHMRKTFSNIVNEDLVYYLKDIKSECLLIWGKDDQDTPLKDGKTMNKLIKNSALITLNGNHFCYLQNIKLLNMILYEYLKDEMY